MKVKTILAGTGGLGLACALWLTVLSAGAQSQPAPQVSLTQSTWYWQDEVAAGAGVAVPGSPPAIIPDPTVPAGDLAVSGPEQQGNAPKETYLEFDVSSIPSGSTISSFKISIPVDPSAQYLVPAGTVPTIIACTPQVSWSGDPGPQPPTQKPTDHCDPAAPKVTTSDSGKTYTVDITSIANSWVSGGGQNFGVAITDDPTNASTAYQVAFGPASAISKMQATIDYVPPQSGLTQGPTDNTNATPAGNAGSISGVATPAAPSTPLFPVSSSAGSPPATAAPLPAPSTAPNPSARAPVKQAAARSAATSTPPVGFWIVGVLLAALIAACVLELRGPPEIPNAGVERGVGRMLSRLAARNEGSLSEASGGLEVRRPGNEQLG
ncbi:MAG TPA: DNRLRE domain-containing protein [Acidimicrobiales bacterium]|nr:DNRLRE domain-containing protein [Acidimicrobiales bacterium]